jgi:hypothetical protein
MMFLLYCGIPTPRIACHRRETLLTVPLSGSIILGQGCLIWARVIEREDHVSYLGILLTTLSISFTATQVFY